MGIVSLVTFVLMGLIVFELVLMLSGLAVILKRLKTLDHLVRTVLGSLSKQHVAETKTTPKRKYVLSGKYSAEALKAKTKKGRAKLNGWKRRRISKGIRAYWANLTPEQHAKRIADMKRARTINKQFKLNEVIKTD